jgi:hypothetical protein
VVTTGVYIFFFWVTRRTIPTNMGAFSLPALSQLDLTGNLKSSILNRVEVNILLIGDLGTWLGY